MVDSRWAVRVKLIESGLTGGKRTARRLAELEKIVHGEQEAPSTVVATSNDDVGGCFGCLGCLVTLGTVMLVVLVLGG